MENKMTTRREVFIAALVNYWENELYLLFKPNASMLKLAASFGIDPLEILRSYYFKLTERRV
jgi:hypothetical protein